MQNLLGFGCLGEFEFSTSCRRCASWGADGHPEQGKCDCNET